MQSDAQLIEALHRGDQQAYMSLFQRHERSARAVALAVLHDHHTAQDAVQEGFLTAYQKAAGLRDAAAFQPWLLQIVRRHAIQIARRAHRARAAERHAAPPADPSNNGRLDEGNQQLLNAIMRLPKHEQTIVMLHYLDAQPVKTIAAMTGRPVGTITMRLSRARARLRKWLQEPSP